MAQARDWWVSFGQLAKDSRAAAGSLSRPSGSDCARVQSCRPRCQRSSRRPEPGSITRHGSKSCAGSLCPGGSVVLSTSTASWSRVTCNRPGDARTDWRTPPRWRVNPRGSGTPLRRIRGSEDESGVQDQEPPLPSTETLGASNAGLLAR